MHVVRELLQLYNSLSPDQNTALSFVAFLFALIIADMCLGRSLGLPWFYSLSIVRTNRPPTRVIIVGNHRDPRHNFR